MKRYFTILLDGFWHVCRRGKDGSVETLPLFYSNRQQAEEVAEQLETARRSTFRR